MFGDSEDETGSDGAESDGSADTEESPALGPDAPAVEIPDVEIPEVETPDVPGVGGEKPTSDEGDEGPTPGEDIDPETYSLFWRLVLVLDVAIFCVVVGPVYILLRGDWTVGGLLILLGLSSFGYAVSEYRSFKAAGDETEPDDDADSTTTEEGDSESVDGSENADDGDSENTDDGSENADDDSKNAENTAT